MTPRTILVVAPADSVRAAVVETIAARGHEVLTAETFAAGRRLLVERQPDVLLTTVRLHEHNGLHLAIVSRLASALTKTIVLGYADQVLEAEARQAGAFYLTDARIADIVSAIEQAIETRERRWPRTQTNITAQAADYPVRILDLSYGGFRIELASNAKLPERDRFDLSVCGLRIPALPVWTKWNTSRDRLWCGAAVSELGEVHTAWRELVDSAKTQAIQ